MTESSEKESAQICTSGKAYWSILKRVNANPGPMMRRVASHDMAELLPATKVAGVRKRINAFIARNRPQSPSKPPFGSGPRVA